MKTTVKNTQYNFEIVKIIGRTWGAMQLVADDWKQIKACQHLWNYGIPRIPWKQ